MVAKAMNNIEAARKGYARLTAILNEHGMPTVVEMVSMMSRTVHDLTGRGESAVVADMLGRVPDDEWAKGVQLAVDAHLEFWADSLRMHEERESKRS